MVLWLLACKKEESPPVDTDTDLPPIGSFVTAAEAAGYLVQEGRLRRLEEDCCAPGANCLFSNPTAPYLVYTLPPSPGQSVTDPATVDGMSQNYHLRTDEAVVLLGQTPPAARYFGAASYIGYRIDGGELIRVGGSTGPSLNLAVIAETHGAEDVFGSPYAVVTTMDGVVERQLVEWLVGSGWDPAHVHVDGIPVELARPGLTLASDTFSNVTRVALFDDPSAGAAYLADPGATLLRLTPVSEEGVPAEVHPARPMPTRGSGTSEQAWRLAAGLLGNAIRARYPDLVDVETESVAGFVEPYQCIADGYCAFDTTDRYYARSVNLFLGDEAFVVGYGVNHQRAGKASYTSVAINEEERLLEIGGLEDPAMVGTAREYLPNDPLVDDLYVVHFARDCAPFPAPCLEVPTGCPGAETTEALYLSYRAYLEPGTGAAPLPTELVLDRAIKFFAPLPTIPKSTGDTGVSP